MAMQWDGGCTHQPWRRWLNRDREQHCTTGLRESVRLHMVSMVMTTAVVLQIWLRPPQRPPSDGSPEPTPPDDVGVRGMRKAPHPLAVVKLKAFLGQTLLRLDRNGGGAVERRLLDIPLPVHLVPSRSSRK